MDGVEFCRTVRDRAPSLPLIVCVDEAGDGAEEAIEAGATDLHTLSSGSEGAELLASRIELAVCRDRAETEGNRDAADATADRSDDGAAVDARESSLVETELTSVTELDRYRSFVDRVADPMYVLDEQGRCIVVNDALLEYTGYERDQIEGRQVGEFISDPAYETATTTIERLYEQNDSSRDAFEVPIRAADGETRIGEAHITVITTDSGDYAGSVGVIRDITERKERLRELGQYKAIVEIAPIGLLVVDEDGHIIWHNEEFTDDLGITDRVLVGTDFANLQTEGYFPNATLENYLERVRHLLSSENDDDQVAYEEEWVGDDGERGITEVNMGLLPLEDGEFAGTVYAFRNVTDRITYREELERQNERLEKFASLVSHDLRNPLNVAQGHLDLLETKCDDESIDETRWAVNRMEELIDDLLALARYGRTVADREQIELAELAEVAWAGVDTADATMIANLEGTITAHKGRVRELLENLFRNAIDHGGEDVTVTVGQFDLESEQAGFFVEDDGSGLPDSDDIFEFGHTTADDGTGLGLGIVTEIADAHGWGISAYSGDDGGARFEIRGVTILDGEQPTG
ncbi:PAS domain S-box protein [Natrinema sp. 1APR25-10V2]|uniref:PAS domain S-box protein n=1 Tax=Natrinema sp. 1APR25-10V2 TaxID=2951081 RepID=UPI00287462FD|nr:PAS domain S-box protein [Natrinema sp. 1APR25-10V2]MDS0476648.1 PAS domain S-box protein [Natrinema sp. 1APR25-10V2]